MRRLAKVYESARKYKQPEVNEGASTSRGSVKSRLGFKQFDRAQQFNRGGRVTMDQGSEISGRMKHALKETNSGNDRITPR